MGQSVTGEKCHRDVSSGSKCHSGQNVGGRNLKASSGEGALHRVKRTYSYICFADSFDLFLGQTSICSCLFWEIENYQLGATNFFKECKLKKIRNGDKAVVKAREEVYSMTKFFCQKSRGADLLKQGMLNVWKIAQSLNIFFTRIKKRERKGFIIIDKL